MSPLKDYKATILYVRVYPAMHAQLTALADRECRSITSVVRQAIKEFMERRADSGKK